MVYIGADHAGFDLKEMIKEHLSLTGYHVEDMGAHELDPTDDYPQYAAAVAEAVLSHPGSVGILSCGNAEGVCIAANKFDSIRAGVGYSEEAAHSMRSDDNTNIICIPGRLQTEDDPLGIVAAFLATPFSKAPRHIRRLSQVHALEHGDQALTHVVPAVLVQTEDAFREKMSHPRLRNVAPIWQVDILDGTMFDAESWADVQRIKRIDHLPEIELHLMIEDPIPVIEAWQKHIPSLKRAIIHAEIPGSLRGAISRIKDLDLDVGIAVNPETELKPLRHELELADLLLIMGIHPGASGRPFLGRPILRKIRWARKHLHHLQIAIDGGVTQKTARKMVKAGATQLCAASAIWSADDPVRAYAELQHAGER